MLFFSEKTIINYYKGTLIGSFICSEHITDIMAEESKIKLSFLEKVFYEPNSKGELISGIEPLKTSDGQSGHVIIPELLSKAMSEYTTYGSHIMKMGEEVDVATILNQTEIGREWAEKLRSSQPQVNQYKTWPFKVNLLEGKNIFFGLGWTTEELNNYDEKYGISCGFQSPEHVEEHFRTFGLQGIIRDQKNANIIEISPIQGFSNSWLARGNLQEKSIDSNGLLRTCDSGREYEGNTEYLSGNDFENSGKRSQGEALIGMVKQEDMARLNPFFPEERMPFYNFVDLTQMVMLSEYKSGIKPLTMRIELIKDN